MKKAIALLLSAVFATTAIVPLGLTATAANSAPTVIPAIRSWTGGSGSFAPNASTALVDLAQTGAVGKVQTYFRDMLGLELGITTSSVSSNAIIFELDTALASSIGNEGYTLEATTGKIVIKAPTDTGLLYGGITVVQSLSVDGAFPCGSAVDYPEYEIRSGMLDVGRAWMPLEHVEEITKYMAYFKMNEIHLHINDDGSNGYAGFRLESNVKGLSSKDGYYTKDEYRAYQKRMLEYGVTVITEIDTPAHSRCFSTVENPPAYLESNGRCLDISKEETVEFVKNLLAEYMTGDDPVFVSKIVHIGTDEYPREYADQMVTYTDTLIKYVNSLGYTPRFWGGLGPNGFSGPYDSGNAQMNFWDLNISGVSESLASDYDIINTVNNTLYVVPTTNYNFPDYFDLEKLYTKWQVNYFNVDGTYKMDADDDRLLGACFALWNDLHTTYHGVTRFDIFDRLRGMVCLIAEKTWLGDATKNITASNFIDRYNKLSLRAGDADPGRHSVPAEGLSVDFEGSVPEYVNLNGGNIENGAFVLDGSSYLSLTPDAIGFPNTLEFDIYLEEATTAPIFAGDVAGSSVEILADADGKGNFGFKTEVYTFTYDYQIPVGEKTHICLSSDLTTTNLIVNNSLCYTPNNALNPNGTKLSTLTAPLSQIGKGIKGYIDNISVRPEVVSFDSLLVNNNVALGAKATASSLEVDDGRFTADLAVDGDDSDASRVSFGRDTDVQWLLLDLGKEFSISKFEISFKEHVSSYEIQVSENGTDFTTVYKLEGGVEFVSQTDEIVLDKNVNARYVKYVQLKRFVNPNYPEWGYYSGGIKEFRAFAFDMSAFNELLERAEAFIAAGDKADARYNEVVKYTNELKAYLTQDKIFVGNAQLIANSLEKALNAPYLPNLVYGNAYTTSIAANASYPDESGKDLTNGIIITHEDNQATSPYNDPRWVGFNVGTARSVDVVIPLGDGNTVYNLDKVIVNIGGDKLGAGVTEPDLKVYYTIDGENYTEMGDYTRSGDDKYALNVVVQALSPVKAKAIKVNASLANISGKNLVWLGEIAAYEYKSSNNVALNKPYTTSPLYSVDGVVSYPDENGVTLTDGKDASEAKYNDTAWAGFNRGTDFCKENGYASIIVDLGASYDLDRFVVKAASKQCSNGIAAPDRIQVYVSSDNENWTYVGKADYTDDETAISVSAELMLDSVATARYVEYRVFFQDVTNGINWAFVSEVEAYGSEATAKPEPEPEYVPGDVNNDGVVGSADYLLVKRSCFNSYVLSEDEAKRANIDGNDKVDSSDYVLVKRIAFGTYKVTEEDELKINTEALLPVKSSYNLLFIGNSATYVNDIPATLASLCAEKGITITQTQLVQGGNTLEQHAANPDVLAEIAKGYDAVFLQENGNSMTSAEAREKSLAAIETLGTAIKNSGAKFYFYVRPPYGIDLSTYDTLAQCELFDEHFTPAAEEYGASCVYVNRAFAYSRMNNGFYLWGSDNAHTNTYGAYLAVCTFYSTLFGKSATELGVAYGISAEDAVKLQQVADQIALYGVIPWEA